MEPINEKDYRITKMSATKQAIEFVELCLKYDLIKCSTHKELFKYFIAYERQITKEIIKKQEG